MPSMEEALKIVNIAFEYMEGHSYQDNILPKYQARLGHDVVVITRHSSKGKPDRYVNSDGLIIQVSKRKKGRLAQKLGIHQDLYQLLENEKPDLIFLHGVQSLASLDVCRFMEKHPSAKLVVDNHADFTNSAMNWFSKNVLHKIIWKHCAHKVDKYAAKWFCVLPCRIDFVVDLYGISRERCELLVMGGDDDYVSRYTSPDVIFAERKKHGIKEDDFVICSGGKIDRYKAQTLTLMKAVKKVADPHVRLFVYGSVSDDLKAEFDSLVDGEKIVFLGWLSYEPVYEAISMSDLIVFPGRHSVLWEQCAAMSKPLVVRYLPGTQHVDFGGNTVFLYEDTEEELVRVLSKIVSDKDIYSEMKKKAQACSENFLYSRIAEQSLRGFES